MRILTIRESVWLNASPQRVWEKLENVELWPSWHEGLREVRWRGRLGLRAGHRFLLRGKETGDLYLRGGRILSVDAGRSFFWGTGIGPARAKLGLCLAEDGCGTLIQFQTEFRGWAIPWVANASRVDRLRLFQRGFLQMIRESIEKVGSLA